MKGRKDTLGVVFDVPENKYERFMDVYKHLTETESRLDFSISKCTELPELSEDFGSEFGNWRGGDDFGSGSGGGNFSGGGGPFGGRHGRH